MCPDATVIPYGSYATGLWLPTSDVDMVVQGAGSLLYLNKKKKMLIKKRKSKRKKEENKRKKEEEKRKKKREEDEERKKNGVKGDGEGGGGGGGGGEEGGEKDQDKKGTETKEQQQQQEQEKEEELYDDRTPEMLLASSWEAFQCIYTQLLNQPWAENVIAITTSRMPVIKLTLTDGYNQIPFDVTIDPGLRRDVHPDQYLAIHSGLPVLQLVQYCLTKMKGLATLTLVIKQFLRERGLNDTYRGGMCLCVNLCFFF